MKIDLAASLSDGLGISPGGLVAIAGAGGKTSLMYGLGRELAAARGRVLLTTTTKIFYPDGDGVAAVVLGPETQATMARVRSGLATQGPVLAGRERQQSKIVGFSPSFVDALYSQAAPVTLVAECDGAMGKSLKAPREWEPVLPAATTVYVVVVGADCLGKSLASGLVFQPEGVAALAGVEPGANVDTAVALRTILSPGSYGQRRPGEATFCVFINKWDAVRARAAEGRSTEQDPALTLALELKKSAEVDRVVLGSIRSVDGTPMVVIT